MPQKVWIILLLSLSIFAFSSLLRPGYFPMHDDMQAMRILQMKKCFNDVQIPCRWVPDMGYGYGYPQFHYYPPLPYYIMTIAHLGGVSILASAKFGFVLSFIIPAIGMYLLGKRLWETEQSGVLSALFYIYLPYRAMNVYSRGAMGEIWAMAFFPWVFYTLESYFQTGNKRYLLGLSLSISALMTSHLLSTLMIAPFLVAWGIYRLISATNFRNSFIQLTSSAILGLGLAAYYVFPALIEKPAAHLETLTQGYFGYQAHFVSLRQLFLNTHWGYGSSLEKAYDDMSFLIGLIHWPIAIVSLLLGLVYAYKFTTSINKTKKLKQFISKNSKIVSLSLLLISLLGYAFMAHVRSTPVWSAIHVLEILQFPWRFLAPASFLVALAAGSIATWRPIPFPKLLIIIIPLIVLNIGYLQPRYWININDEQKFAGVLWDKQQTISIFDYLPIDAVEPPSEPAPEQPWFVTGEGRVTQYTKGSNWQSGQFEVIQPGELRLPLFHFPGMQVRVDNHVVPHTFDNFLGLITIPVEEGTHTLRVKLLDTPIRLLSNGITLLSLTIWLMITYKRPFPSKISNFLKPYFK